MLLRKYPPNIVFLCVVAKRMSIYHLSFQNEDTY